MILPQLQWFISLIMTDNEKKHRQTKKLTFPRRRLIRALLKAGIDLGSELLLDYRVEGQENMPEGGPLLIVGNHFHFLDTIAPIHVTPYSPEFIGDAIMPMAPWHMKIFPRLWQTLQIRQGTANLESLRLAEQLLAQNGVLALFPQGHVQKPPLVKPLPGAAFLALRSRARILPIGTYSEDNWNIFGSLGKKRRRARVISRIGKPFGPLLKPDSPIPGRNEVNAAGEEIMRRIAELLPPHTRGLYGQEA